MHTVTTQVTEQFRDQTLFMDPHKIGFKLKAYLLCLKSLTQNWAEVFVNKVKDKPLEISITRWTYIREGETRVWSKEKTSSETVRMKKYTMDYRLVNVKVEANIFKYVLRYYII